MRVSARTLLLRVGSCVHSELRAVQRGRIRLRCEPNLRQLLQDVVRQQCQLHRYGIVRRPVRDVRAGSAPVHDAVEQPVRHDLQCVDLSRRCVLLTGPIESVKPAPNRVRAIDGITMP